MKRRTCLAAASAALLSPRARAAVQPLGPSPMGMVMRAMVQRPSIVKQQCPLWCWAASAAMIFGSHDHPIDQMVIVQRVFGGLVCAPSGNTTNITAILNVPWIDARGEAFRPHITAGYDVFNGILAINNTIIISELADDRPLLYCNQSHAMVLVACDFVATPVGPRILAAGVLDPMPGVPDFHALSPGELVPAHLGGALTYVAAVRT